VSVQHTTRTIKVGVVYRSDATFELVDTRRQLEIAFRKITDEHSGTNIVIVTGIAAQGITPIVEGFARDHGWPIHGVGTFNELEGACIETVTHTILEGGEAYEIKGFLVLSDILVCIGADKRSRDQVELFESRYRQRRQVYSTTIDLPE